MSYDNQQSAIRHGGPEEIYVFETSPNVFLAYNSGTRDFAFTFDPGDDRDTVVLNCYATPIDRGSISYTGSTEASNLEITMTKRADIIQRLNGFPPSSIVTVSVLRYHPEDPQREKKVLWFGRVLNSSIKGMEGTLSCDDFGTGMQRVGLRRNYQYGCPHALYGPSCKAPRVEFAGVVVSLDATAATLTVPLTAIDAQEPEWFLGGVIEWGDPKEVRAIIGSSIEDVNLKLTLGGALRDLAVADTVRLYRGCPRNEQACIEIHDNVLNYGGCPWIPLKNPIGKVSTFI